MDKKRVWKKIGWGAVGSLVVYVGLMSYWGYEKEMPDGYDVRGEVREGEVEWLVDRTYTKEDKRVVEQEIFDRVYKSIDEAEEFVFIDMFLFNDVVKDKSKREDLPYITDKWVEHLIEKKKSEEKMEMYVMMDPINSFYGSYDREDVKRLRDVGIKVGYSDLTDLRDSNPVYSGFWRTFMEPLENGKGDGWLSTPFGSEEKGTIRSYAELLNMKGNHRKVVVTEKEGFVLSANAHDESGLHSNVGVRVEGKILEDILDSESAVVRHSGYYWDIEGLKEDLVKVEKDEEDVLVQLLTEGSIKDKILDQLSGLEEGNDVKMGMFYLSDRDVVEELKEAANRGVNVKVVLDANKDAFGMEKNGIPNRPVAKELMEVEGIDVRWYVTNGEQFHTKVLLMEKEKEREFIVGSANYTKRNIGNFNLESNVWVKAEKDHELMEEVNTYFEEIWNNEEGVYTVGYEAYEETSKWKRWMYLLQEKTGLSSF